MTYEYTVCKRKSSIKYMQQITFNYLQSRLKYLKGLNN